MINQMKNPPVLSCQILYQILPLSDLRNVSREVKKVLNENFNYKLSESAEITLDTISILCTSDSWEDVYDKADRKVVRAEWRNVINYIKSNDVDLESNNIQFIVNREDIQFTGINENNLLFITKFIIDALMNVNDVYIDDLQACIPVDDNIEYLKENNPELADEYENMIDKYVNY